MAVMSIYLPEISDVAEFVNIMSQFPYEAQLHVGNYSVDAKSIMGIFTLDREQPIQLELQTTNEAALSKLSAGLNRFLYKPVH
ncbi:MAG: HPr family phosphocarrier protein [Oscillospiraceae bacterium]|nr:HPr family phosphocarrier protein [Oscillospiraceae bacterium]